MNEVGEIAQQQLTPIIAAVIGLLTTVVLAMLALVQRKINVWLVSKTSNSDRELLYKMASEAFAIAENAFNSQAGKAKMNFAYSYTSDLISKIGVKFSDDEIKAAIEKAVLDYNLKKKVE